MNLRKTFSGAAVATTLLLGAALPAYAANIDLGGYSGPVQLNFNNYESFLTSSGTVDNAGPQVGDQNVGIFTVQSITAPSQIIPLWTPGKDGEVLVGVFNGVTVTSVSGTPAAETTTNSGGVFNLYLVPTAQFLGDQGLAGYTSGGCSVVGGLCYNGITNTLGGSLALTMTLTPGIIPGDMTTTLSAQVNATLNPPTGNAAFDGMLSNTTQFAPDVFGKDSFCPNLASNCAGHDNSTFQLASQDPIIAQAIPEPGTLAVFGGGLLVLGSLAGWRRKRNRGAAAV